MKLSLALFGSVKVTLPFDSLFYMFMHYDKSRFLVSLNLQEGHQGPITIDNCFFLQENDTVEKAFRDYLGISYYRFLEADYKKEGVFNNKTVQQVVWADDRRLSADAAPLYVIGQHPGGWYYDTHRFNPINDLKIMEYMLNKNNQLTREDISKVNLRKGIRVYGYSLTRPNPGYEASHHTLDLPQRLSHIH